jgi:hypothetical protein
MKLYKRRTGEAIPVGVELVTVVFGHTGGPTTKFGRLLHAWCASAVRSNPGGRIVVVEADPPDMNSVQMDIKNSHKVGCINNSYKLHIWKKYIDEVARYDVVFLDCDMVILRDLAEGFCEKGGSWDVAWTRRSGRNYINGGTVFCRNTQGTRDFMAKWCDVNDYIFSDRQRLERHLNAHLGLNQTALHKMLVNNMIPETCRIVDLPCLRYNCCDQHWHEFGPHVSVLHVKSALQREALSMVPDERFLPRLREAGRVYRSYDPIFSDTPFPEGQVNMMRLEAS